MSGDLLDGGPGLRVGGLVAGMIAGSVRVDPGLFVFFVAVGHADRYVRIN